MVALGTGMVGILAQLARRYFELAKEIADILLGAVALVLSLPILAVCAVLITLSSSGAVFYKQVRVGKDGELFTMYKLRTMHADAENGRALWASRNDPRVVAACRWMRRTHADELPQLINVIKGEMSLVGPRPERPEILTRLGEVYPDIRKRLSVRPGITGLAQIRNGYDTSVENVREKLRADLEYISHRNWSTELRILIGTLRKLYDRCAH